MYIKKIELVNFKSYVTGQFDFSPRLNVIYGDNGVGKTNLLDAIYVLAMTRSNFRLAEAQLIRDGADFYRLAGVLEKPEGEVHVVIKLAKGKKKVIEQNQSVVAKSIDHIGFIPVVMITPDDLNLINATNTERRKLADSTLSQIDHDYLQNLAQYNRLLKQRNMLLKQGLEHRNLDLDLLNTYDQSMDVPAATIYRGRKLFFDMLKEQVQYYYQILSDGTESVTIEYTSHMADDTISTLAARNASRDRATGRTNYGIHRDAIRCLIDGRDGRIFGSQGQKKSLVFAIKLAQLDFMSHKLASRPILLLDDIFDRLDQQRVKHLLSIILSDTFGQIFITDTQWNRIEQILSLYQVPLTKIEITQQAM